MIINLKFTSWPQLLNHFSTPGINLLESLETWCQEKIKSDFKAASLNEIQTLCTTVFKLNQRESWEAIIDNKDGRAYAVIHIVALKGLDRFIEKALPLSSNLLDLKTSQGHTPLHLSAHSGSFKVMSYLLSQGADANFLNQSGKLPLHYSITPLPHKNLEQRIAGARLLLSHTDIEVLFNCEKQAQNEEPILSDILHLGDELDLIKNVLEKNPAFLSLTNSRGENLLHKAIIENREKVFDFLVQNHEALAKVSTGNFSNVLHLACRYGSKNIILKTLTLALKLNHENHNPTQALDEHSKRPWDHLNQRTEPEIMLLKGKIKPSFSDPTESRIRLAHHRIGLA